MIGFIKTKKTVLTIDNYRSWKGYLFEVLNELQDDDMIYQFKNGKSVIILDDGIKKAEQLKQKYLQ